MSDYIRQLQRIVKDYRKSGEAWPASTAEIARWAIHDKRYSLREPTIERILRRELSQAMREEYITDARGRRVRAKHPAMVKREGEQIMLWDDIRTAPRTHMEMAFAHRRTHIVGERRQVKTDVDSYNDANPNQQPIQMMLDFRRDVEELETLCGREEEKAHGRRMSMYGLQEAPRRQGPTLPLGNRQLDAPKNLSKRHSRASRLGH